MTLRTLTLALSLVLLASVASAGPNAGGTLIVHDATLSYTGDPDYCGEGAIPGSCGAADVNLGGSSLTNQRVWKIYAAFPPSASPRLSGVTLGVCYPPNIVITANGPCADFDLPDATWPASGTNTALTFAAARTSSLVELYWFAGYRDGGSSDFFRVTGHASDGGVFADDSVPAIVDPVAAWGRMGFDVAGSAECPPTVATRWACCLGSTCRVATADECACLGGAWLSGSGSCDPNPCEPPDTGRCPEIIDIRTGQVGGIPGSPPTMDNTGPVDDDFRYYTEAGCNRPLTTLDFTAARSGPPAELIVPHPAPTWIPVLPSDPDARWVNWNHGTIGPTTGSGRPAQSVLYAYEFQVATPGNPTARIEAWWAADDFLGAPSVTGVYVNGFALDLSFTGTGASQEHHAAQGTVPLVTGSNWLYVYQRDGGCAVSGLIFSSRITVEETIRLRTGQVGGVPGAPPTMDNVGPMDDCFRYYTEAGCDRPLTTLDFTAARSGPPAELIVPHPAPTWIPFLPSDPDARWVNWNHGTIGPTIGSGRPAQSVLYACPFEVCTEGDPCARVTVAWAVDDFLGDATRSGVWINGVELNRSFTSTTGASTEHIASQANVPLVTGTNWLYVYQHDGGCSVSGLLLSATIRINETITLRTGQAARRPSGDPTLPNVGPVDDTFTCYYDEALGCGTALPLNFALARTGPRAERVVPNTGWLAALPADPDARWINWNHGTLGNGSGRPPLSVLYAARFTVTTPVPVADITCRWAVDDRVGDPGASTGIWVNGWPLALSGGGFNTQTVATATGVPLQTGDNYLYVYARDASCVVSGLLLSCTIAVCDTLDVVRIEDVTTRELNESRALRITPNPTLGRTTIAWQIGAPTSVQAAIYDAGGRRVCLLYDGPMDAGEASLTWDGMIGVGQPAHAGVYFVRVREEGSVRTGRIVLR